MSVWKNWLGTMSQWFKIGGPLGPRFKNSSGVIELRNTGDTAYATARAAVISAGATINDIVSLLDLQGRVPNITWSFDGSSPPSPGTNTGAFGIVHTTGGAYTAGRIYYDDGSSLVLMPTEVVRTITTASAVTGTINLIANGLYALQGGAWTLKGDGTGSATGLQRWIEVPFDYNDAGTPVDSSTSVPDGARVVDTRILVETAFPDGTPTLQVTINGSSPETVMATSGNEPGTLGEYQDATTHLITSSNEGLVRVAVGGTPTAGAGRALVAYAIPLA